MNTILKRLISIVLCFVLVAGYLPVGALAEEMDTVQEPSADTTVVVEEEAAAEAEENEDTSLTEDDENTSTVGDAEKEVGEEPSADEETETPSEGDEVVTEEDVTEDETVTEEPAEDESVTEEPATEESATEETVTEETASIVEEVSLVAPLLDADETTYVLAGSDFQARNGDDAGAAIINGVLDNVKVDYSTMDGFLFAGDYSVNATKESNVTALKNTILNADLGLTEDDLVLIQGNHDNSSEYSGATAGLVGSVLNNSGANDADDYGVFVINEQDYMWKNSNESTIKETAENLESYLNAKRNAQYTKPIFVVSHLPLHYCMRTRNDGDGMYANYIFDVLNEAGNAGLNIIFMFGHNHSHGWDDYLGGAAIFLTEGNKMNVAQRSKTVFEEETLAFTYMNAGYVGYYGDSYTSDVDKTLTMTTFAITDTNVTISRYDSNGTHDLKSAGVYNVEHPDSAYYSTDTTTVGTPYTLTLNTEITPAGEEVEAPDSGNTGGSVVGSIEQVTALEQGVPYIIVCDRNGLVLTGTATTNKDGKDSLLLSGEPNVSTTDLWYYDGTHLIYGNPNSTSTYLLMSTDTAYLGESHSYRMVDDVYLNNDGATFSLNRTVDKLYLNQYGGGSYTAASPYTSDGNSDAGSKWRIYKLVTGTGGSVNITGYSVEPAVGTVTKGASPTAWAQAEITVHLESGDDYTVPITVSMLTKADGSSVSTGEEGTFENLKLTYNDVVITESFTLNVVAKTGNNYPEYPNEGAVKVNKTGTGIDFQSSGIAQVEISASGVPMKKGADVIVMLDLSSSMTNTVDGKTRLSVLEASLQSLMTQLKANGDDGEPMDIRIAVADFNRYYTDSSSPYYINSADHLKNGSIRTNNSGTNQVYTGSHGLNAGAFVSVHDLETDAFSGFGYKSGTNYDYAFDAVYQLGEAITTQNANDGTERDLFVIFMSDGAPFQYNYFSSQSDGSGADYWNNWLQGTMTDSMFDSNARNDYYNEEGKHWMAEAIKGDPDLDYRVIRKNNAADTDGDNWVEVKGLGAKMYSIGFCLAVDKKITVATMDTVIRNIASEEQYYFRADTAADLNNAFKAIGGDIAYAAYNARFVDQMGDDYNLQMADSNYSVVDGTTTTGKTIKPKIEIISYDIYTRQDYLNGTITEDKIGDRKGTYTVLETVTFDANGTEAYSDKKSGNILIDGVICAQSFWYNTNATAVAVEGVSIPTGKDSANLTTGTTNLLPAETFYWKMGTVQTSELAMRYYVYLDGSMEGTREGGSYPTNEYATLYYDNYLGNPCYKDTVSPVMPWKEANVSYAFYLVNENGEIIVNQTTGQTGSFANKIAVTNPVVYKTVLLNNEGNVQAIKVADVENSILPLGYELYDSGAEYEVKINSNTSGSWAITKGNAAAVASTYVTQFNTDDASAYSNALTNNTIGDDYTHTVVWFAVLWKVQALPDSVVIDYGLPVDISVLANDMFGENGKLAGVGAYSDSLNLDGHNTVLASGFNTNYTGTYGYAKADASTGKVRYTLRTMEMNGYEKFAYAVNYTGNENAGYYYDTVTVIPATTIYYEDDFLTYESFTWDYTNNQWETRESSLWAPEGDATSDATQDEDRPGQYALTDANNIYGYDSVNKNMSVHSLESAMKATVDYDNYAQASFTFYGTGFDIISMTSNMTGTILVEVDKKDESDAWTKYDRFSVDTYYGYKQESGDADGDGTVEDGEMIWVVNPDANGSLYQVPVLKMVDKPYGQYKVTIKATYDPAFDHVANSQNYDFYLDAIRIYDPANDGASDGTADTTIEDAYKADGEGWPSYFELRNQLIDTKTLGNTATSNKITGEVFIDGDAAVGDAQIADYIGFGPNNEVYLNENQSIAFLLDVPGNIANVHIGIKSADGLAATYTIKNIAQKTVEGKYTAGEVYNEKTYTVDTTTDMYYDLTGWDNDIIVISNTGTSGILSLTNIKFTYTSDPNAAAPANEMPVDLEENMEAPTLGSAYITPNAANLTLRALNASDEEEIPEVTEPEESIPESSVPEETDPIEPTEPEETEPEDTEPEETKPTEDNNKLEQAIKNALKEVGKTLKKLFGSWFK